MAQLKSVTISHMAFIMSQVMQLKMISICIPLKQKILYYFIIGGLGPHQGVQEGGE